MAKVSYGLIVNRQFALIACGYLHFKVGGGGCKTRMLMFPAEKHCKVVDEPFVSGLDGGRWTLDGPSLTQF